MYEIRKDGGVIALTEAPDYIRRHPDGFWLLCGEDEAEGVAVGGTPMLLSQIILVKRDTGTFLQETRRQAPSHLSHWLRTEVSTA